MVSGKVITLVIAVALFIFVHQTDAWRRRRRRRCPVQNCQVGAWSSWSSCSASECGQEGSQSRTRQKVSSASCGGAQCPNLSETRHCYGNTPQDCQVSSWSPWSFCSTAQCGQQGSQSKSRTEVSSSACGGAPCPNLSETRHCYGNTPQDCQVSSWSPWSFCSTAQCGQQGSQSKSRTEVSSSACGGAPCPDLLETRLCYANKPVDCQLNSWSEWSACTTPCGVSGTQHSDRHRNVTEQCGGKCTSTFRKTRACPELSCLNGGRLKDGKCFCIEGYSGYCCEKGEYCCKEEKGE